eukprot:m.27797 g.27797  ORF g.27797 m.27797 type:complete len:830 (-) comp9400_c0_seq1:77-2566(-)
MDGLMRVDGVISPLNGLAFAIDIGGSLAKVAYFTMKKRTRQRSACDPSIDRSESHEEPTSEEAEAGRLHLGYFETSRIESCIKFIKEKMGDRDSDTPCMVRATGGGAHKFTELFAEEQLLFHKLGEMECLVRGCNYVLKHVEDEAFSFDITNTPQRLFRKQPHSFPYLLVNIGSGVSIIKVDSDSSYERVDGSAVGGGTFLGLASLLTHVRQFGDILSMADEGDCGQVDMLVKDIYGEATPPSLGLNPDITASCFGKARKVVVEQSLYHDTHIQQQQEEQKLKKPKDEKREELKKEGEEKDDDESGEGKVEVGKTSQQKRRLKNHHSKHCKNSSVSSVASISSFRNEDMLASLVQMICFNIAQIACLNARLHNTNTIFFAGFFIRNHARIMHIITQAVGYWGQGRITALFLRHEGYLGAIGSFLGGLDTSDRSSPISNLHSLAEQYVSSSSHSDLLQESFEFELSHDSYSPFPLLAGKYFADTIDLMTDMPARDYWLQCFKSNIDREWKRAKLMAKKENEDEKSVSNRADAFKSTFLKHMEILTNDPSAYGELSVRNILELRQQCLREFGFPDIYEAIKEKENSIALNTYQSLVDELDKIESTEEEVRLAIHGVLAGNCFDWGAAEVAKKMEEGVIDFHDQRDKIEKRHWLRNDLKAFISAVLSGRYNKAVLFADNSGADIILGIIPFARALIKAGIKVVLTANSLPVLNDITFAELKPLLRAIVEDLKDTIISSALSNGMLEVVPNGSGSPCINLNKVSHSLAQSCHDVNLVVLEGMGRAIHTNFENQFQCDSLKLAMIKNKWLAEKLGGSTYDVVCKLDQHNNALVA